jgi:pimeloyl-ACP methyl ester carboxylesterase
VDSGFAEVNGTRLYYEVSGSGPALLFLHGFTLDRRMWRPQVEDLSSRFRVIAYDARGFGRSALPTTEAYRHCDDAAALCEHLQIGRVVAIGHSIGAHQTLELTLSRTNLVAGWIGVCSSGLATVPFPDDVTNMFAAIRQAARDEGIDAAKTIWHASGWFASARESPALLRELEAILADYSGWHWTHDNPAKLLEPPAAEQLGSLRVPTLVVTGARDLRYNTLIGEQLVSRIPGAVSLRLADAGHMANMEASGTVNRAIAELAERAFAMR